MSDVAGLKADDSTVVRSTAGLLTYLRNLVRKTHKAVRHCQDFDQVQLWWLADLPETVKRPTGRGGVVLTLEYQNQVAAPALPPQLVGWVDPKAIEDPEREPVLAEPALMASFDPSLPRELASPQDSASPLISRDTMEAYRRWLSEWRRWAADERIARPRRELRKGFAAAARKLSQHDDTLEAVLGIGLVTFSSPRTEEVRRHAVTIKVHITVDRRTSAVSVVLADQAVPRVEDRLFLDGDDGFVLEPAEDAREIFTSQAPHPLSDAMLELLQHWQSRAFERPIRFSPSWQAPTSVDETVTVTVAPALIVRRRDQSSLIDYYDRMLEALSQPGATAPLGLAQLLFPLDQEHRMAWRADTGGAMRPLIGDDPLFPLPTNEAQRLVFDRLKRDTAVVVQGPPGTGKTHTIANLIAALLADGKRVLVTSAKDQALQVLRDKLPAPLQNLCVRLTNHRGGGITELEQTLTALSDNAAARDLGQIDQTISTLEERRREIQRRQAMVREQVFQLRESETLAHQVASGYAGTRAEVVEAVNERATRYEWLLPFPDTAPSESPLSAAQARELWHFLTDEPGGLTHQPESYLPDLADLPSPERFAEIAVTADTPSDALAFSTLAEDIADLPENLFAALSRTLETAADALQRLGLPQRAARWDHQDWRTVALRDRLSAQNTVLWQQVATTSVAAQAHLQPLAEQASRHVDTTALTDTDVARAIAPTEAFLLFLSGGGKIRGFLPRPVQRDAEPYLFECEVGGLSPETAPDVSAVLVELRARVAITVAVRAWEHVTDPPAAPSPLALLSKLGDRSAALEDIAHFDDARLEADRLLVSNRIRHPLRTVQAWDELADAVQTARDGLAARRAAQILEVLASQVCPSIGMPAPEAQSLGEAIRRRDPNRYAQGLLDVATARQRRDQRRRCTVSLQRLKDTHPALTEAIIRTAETQPWGDRLTELDAAWAWGRAWAFCHRLSDPGLDQKLQSQLAEADQQLASTLAELAAEQAWRHCLSRMTLEQRQALQLFKNRMADYGKGTSQRYADRYRSSARRAMLNARTAVPAWIMPIPLVTETIACEPDSFDVVIVDEASQAHVDATFLLWLAPHVVIVGDDKQCSPPATSRGALQPLFEMLESCLPDVAPERRLEFSPQSNLYRMLSTHFPDVVRLTDHFRCMPEIIGWSSHQFYRDQLTPLRQFGADRLHPLKVVHVEDGYTDGTEYRIRNEPEALAIINQLTQMLADPAYDNKTFGIIALQGSGQVLLLDRLLEEHIDDSALIEERKIRVGGPQDFQGDDRDVILLSMVVAEPRRALGGNRGDQQRFNVAASRARDQLWLFTSVPAHRLKPDDLRRSLLTYMSAPPKSTATPAELAHVGPEALCEPFQSLFEQRVFIKIRDRGYRVIPQVHAGNRKVIDLVVEGHSGRLGIECDGRHWHTSSEQVKNDIVRELELRRAGWELWRVREGDFLLDPDQALQPLWRELERKDITPDIGWDETPPLDSDWAALNLPDLADDLWKEDEDASAR